MKLYQVRKGQFVYFNNELHKIYSVKPVYKQSVHLIKLKDLTQHLTNASKVERYKPKHLDSFIFNHKTYTLHKEKKAEEGDYILITNPSPDYLDHYSLHEIEIVSSVETKGVITTKSNGVKHNEYLLMVPGRDNDSQPIDYLDKNMADSDLISNDSVQPAKSTQGDMPNIGDVYKKRDGNHSIEAMVVAINGETIILGNNLELSLNELNNSEIWEFQYSLLED
ncbi:hypothetical protein [Priestia filamentosa]|uniref:Uncharacterized protein n=1 Tax=Priestia filamentosa TaxID=1402861 RepID=A0A1X7DY44_9BACI|nr:hypothetical protein [Priestia filamentosa]AKO92188.1 hypothetical protein BEH_08820 [Priestia filamentosa]MDT3762210.1 hypothetical protein [Priestia filamentosa]OXS68781.1 hypothetical protein B1B01_07225 [Priestia filamentosa]RJS64517.1 hypothetical protein CJ485_07085 [Priestia filamentosa]WCM17292.1 hypothetical protein PGN40_08040 [Priestia filamentosa]